MGWPGKIKTYYGMSRIKKQLSGKSSIRNTILALCEILKKESIDIVCIDKIKLDSSFPDVQFKTDWISLSLLGKTEMLKDLKFLKPKPLKQFA